MAIEGKFTYGICGEEYTVQLLHLIPEVDDGNEDCNIEDISLKLTFDGNEEVKMMWLIH